MSPQIRHRYRWIQRLLGMLLPFATFLNAPSLRCQGATTTSSGMMYQANSAAWYRIHSFGWPEIYMERESASTQMVGVPNDLAWTTYVLASADIDYYTDVVSYHFFGGAANGILSEWDDQTGQIDLMSAGYAFTADALPGAPMAQFNISNSSSVTLSLQFDEWVNFRLWYSVGHGGGLSEITPGGWWLQDFSGNGMVDLVRQNITLTLGLSADGIGFIDGYPAEPANPDADLPSIAGGQASPATVAIAWAISPMDQPPPPRPGIVATIPIGMPRVSAGTGFDPEPVGTRSVYASPGWTYIGLQTLTSLGEFRGLIPTSYSLSVGDIPVTSFLADTLPAGANLSLTVGDDTHAIKVGESIDFGPAGATEFTISGLDPTTASVDLQSLIFGLQFAASGYQDVEARAVEYIVASDANLDLTVDAADLAIWQANYGISEAASHQQGDADGDARVDGADFLVWQRQLNSLTSNATVPEPSSTVLMLFASLVVNRWFNNRKA